MSRAAAIIPALVAVASIPQALGQETELNYIKAETREETRAATLAQYQPELA